MKYIITATAFADEWIIEETEDHSGIGSDCDIDIDSSGGLHVSYEYKHGYLGSSAMKYAYKQDDSSSWVLEEVDSDGGYYTGYDNEIALDSNERPHISYVYDIDWEYVPYLKYAYFDGSNWQIEQLTDWQESVERNTTIGIDSGDYPHILYGDWYNGGPMHRRWKDGTGWNEEVVDTGNCRSPHLIIDSNDNLHVVYYAAASGTVKYAFKGDSGWAIEPIEVDSGVYDSSGLDMVLDSSGYPHTVYRGSNKGLRHAYKDGTGWHIENLHTNALGYPSIGIDNSDGLHVSYSIYTSGSNRPLTYSYNGGGGWATEEIETDVQCWNTALDIDPSQRPHIIYYNYNGGITKHAWFGEPADVDDEGVIPATPTGFALYPAYPNPSNGNAQIKFALPEAVDVNLSVYDINGRKLSTLVDEVMAEGEYTTDISGLNSGIYLYELRAGGFSDTKKMVVR